MATASGHKWKLKKVLKPPPPDLSCGEKTVRVLIALLPGLVCALALIKT